MWRQALEFKGIEVLDGVEAVISVSTPRNDVGAGVGLDAIGRESLQEQVVDHGVLVVRRGENSSRSDEGDVVGA